LRIRGRVTRRVHIFSSIVPFAMRRYIVTTFVCPLRSRGRSLDPSTAGFHHGSDRCDAGLQAGSIVEADTLALHVHDGDQKDPAGETRVAAFLEERNCQPVAP
jgi:hypothetical protein